MERTPCCCGLLKEYEEVLFEQKSTQRTHQKELLELDILYKAELEKSKSLEQSLKKYPLVMTKIKTLKNQLNQAKSRSKLLETTLEDLASAHPQALALKALLSSNSTEIRVKEQKRRKLASDLKQYAAGYEQLLAEFRSLKDLYSSEVTEKQSMSLILRKFESALEEAAFEIRNLSTVPREQQEQQEDLLKLRTAVASLNSQLLDNRIEEERLLDKVKTIRKTKTELAAKIETQEHEIAALKEETAALKKETAALKENTLSQEPDTIENESLQRLKQQNFLLTHKYNTLKQTTSTQLDQQQEKISDLTASHKATKQKLVTELNIYKKKVHGLEDLSVDLKENITDLQSTRNHMRKEAREEAKPTILKLQSERDELKRELEDLQQRVDASRRSVLSVGFALSDEFNELGHSAAIQSSEAGLDCVLSVSSYELSVTHGSVISTGPFRGQYKKVSQIARLYELAAERDMLKAEVQKLKTELALVKQEWGLHSKQLREALDKEQKALISAQTALRPPTARKASFWRYLKGSKTHR